MLDAASRFDVGGFQRAAGELRVALRRRGTATVLDDLRQVGNLKARFPRVGADEWTTAVMLNTSGGVAGGDRLDTAFDIQPHARASITSQAAERFYRALPGGAASRVRNQVTVAAGASAEWLPQETILFDRCALDRRLEIELADDAWFVGVESLVFGRAAMGEQVEQAALRDVIRMRRGGVLMLHDAVRMEGELARTMRRKAIAAGARAMATLLHVAPGAEAMLDPLRAAWAEAPGEFGASTWNGMLVARILADSAAALRHTVIAALAVLRESRPLPRVWLC